jgi:hypothetical protein
MNDACGEAHYLATHQNDREPDKEYVCCETCDTPFDPDSCDIGWCCTCDARVCYECRLPDENETLCREHEPAEVLA